MGTTAIAGRFRCPRRRVQWILADPERADRMFGQGNWTDRAYGALSARKVYAVRESAVKRLEPGTP